jgi:hypothetical protein
VPIDGLIGVRELNNDDEELTRVERAIVDHARKRYRRFIFRYGHLAGWLIVPLAAILFIPTMQSYQQRLSILMLAILLFSQSFISTRIIGKLAATVDCNRNIEFGIPPRKAGFSLRSRPGLLFYVLLFPIALFWVRLTETHSTWGLAVIGEAIDVECVLGFYAGIIAILGGVLGTLCTKNQPRYDKLMSFGGELALWLFALIPAAAVLMKL